MKIPGKYFIVACLFLFILQWAPAQVVNVKYSNIRLSSFLDSLKQKSDVSIAYDVNAIPTDSVFDVNFENKHALEIVKHVLSNYPVEISYADNQIIISSTIIVEDDKKYIRIKGSVVDKQNQKSLPFVNVVLQNQPNGTITNSQGLFEFKIPGNCKDSVVVFSFLGYKQEFINVSDSDTTLIIELTPTTIELKEIEVTYKDPDDIVALLWDNHDDNYWMKQALLSGFFRESIRQDGEYVQVSEAIIQIVKPPYNNPAKMERVKFIKGRKKNDLQSMNLVDFKLEGGPFQFSRVDIARYYDFFSKNNNPYKYSYGGVDILAGDIVYKVKFKPLNDDGDLLYSGVLYIHSKSFALVRADFELTKRALKESGRSLIRKTSGKLKVRPVKAVYSIDYRMYKGKWILNKVSGEVLIHINDRKRKINSEFSAVNELLISDWELAPDIKIKPSESFRERYVLANQIDETDDEFWSEYNIIRPDEEIENVFKKK